LLDFSWKDEKNYTRGVCQIWSKEGKKKIKIKIKIKRIKGSAVSFYPRLALPCDE
jgi:hypothetical protein